MFLSWYRVLESYDEDAGTEAHSNDKAASYNETKAIPSNFIEKKATCKTRKFYDVFTFLLIAILI